MIMLQVNVAKLTTQPLFLMYVYGDSVRRHICTSFVQLQHNFFKSSVSWIGVKAVTTVYFLILYF